MTTENTPVPKTSVYTTLSTAIHGSILTNNITGTTTDISWSNYNIPIIPTAEEFKNLTDRITKIEARLAILHPNHLLQDRFPALQEAYDTYKMVEKLVQDPIKEKL